MKLLGVVDRYTLRQWIATFLLSAIGVPAVALLINLSEQFGRLSDNGIPLRNIFLGQALLFPAEMAMLFPAAVLFATVFTLNAMGRHNELTAVKAGGISFYRLIAPMMILAVLSVPVDFELQELSSYTTARQKELHGMRISPKNEFKSNFAYASRSGWTWVGKELQRLPGRANIVLGEGPLIPGKPRWTIAADHAIWGTNGPWILHDGASFAIGDSGEVETFRFGTLRAKAFTESPGALMDEQKKAEEMTLGELQVYLDQLKRAGARPGMLSVDLPLKIAIPVACLVVALFGAPLAVTRPRAGAALGLAIALGTTLIYLTGTQIMKAIGGKEIVQPFVAAWSMNVVFLLLAIVLLARVRT